MLSLWQCIARKSTWQAFDSSSKVLQNPIDCVLNRNMNAVQIAGKAATEHGNEAKREWVQHAQQISHEYLSKRGIDVGRCAIMVHVRPVEGLVRQLDGTLEKRFAKQELQVPLQACSLPPPDACCSSCVRLSPYESLGNSVYPSPSCRLFPATLTTPGVLHLSHT